MGRQERHDVDYFPFFVKDGRTLKLLEYYFKATGTGFFTNLMREFSKAYDHYIDISDPFDREMFFVDTKVNEEDGLKMIEMMVKTGKLDKVLWTEFKVLMSPDFLNSVEDAYRKRSNSCISAKKIRAVYGIGKNNKEEEIEKTPEENGNTPEQSGSNQDNGGSWPQSKVKESKVYIYDFYNSKIDSEQKSSTRTKENIEHWLKHFTQDELIKSIENYSTLALKRTREFRKDPANFFQKRDPAFKDYLPDVFTSTKDLNNKTKDNPFYCKRCQSIKPRMATVNICDDCKDK